MRAREFVIEGGTKKMHHHHKSAMLNITTFKNQNMNSGNQYMNYRMGIALAGAPDYPTHAETYIAGDPLYAPYTEIEMVMVNFAAEQIGDDSKRTWSDKNSRESEGTNTVSPVSNWNTKGNK